MNELIESIRRAYAAQRTPENLVDVGQFHKGGGERWVLRTAVVRQIGQEHWQMIKGQPKEAILALCDELLAAGYSTIPFDWAYRLRRQFEPADFDRFARWLADYVADWGACDDLCTRPLGELVRRFPELLPQVQAWTGAANRWPRRAAAVSLIPAVRQGELLEAALATADALLLDDDDLVQKGYGWLLKEATKHHAGPVFAFVMARKARMPRTALRYAIEKLPREQRAAALAKG